MNINLGGLLGFWWAVRREKKRAAEERFLSVAFEIDDVFWRMQDVIVDHRDEAYAKGRNAAGEFDRAKLPKALLAWARRDQPVIAEHARRVRDIRLNLRMVEGIELLDWRLVNGVLARFDEVAAFLDLWSETFLAFIDGRPDALPRLVAADEAWAALSAKVNAEAAKAGL